MIVTMNGYDNYYYVIYDSETVIYDRNNKKVISVPTEAEAIDFIRDNE